MFIELKPSTLNRKLIVAPLALLFLGNAHVDQPTIQVNPDEQEQEDINSVLNQVCNNIYFDNPDRCPQTDDRAHDIENDSTSRAQSLGAICNNIYFDNPDRCQG